MYFIIYVYVCVQVLFFVIKIIFLNTNKGVSVVVETYYDSKENPDLIPRKDASWEGKSNYTQKELTFFPDNREEDTLDKPKNYIFKF